MYILLLDIFLVGCINSQTENKPKESLVEDTQTESEENIIQDTIVEENDSHTSEISIDWQGTYTGMVPCADCEGIATTIVLSLNKTYTIKTKYIGKANKTFEQIGFISFNSKGNTITLSDIKDAPNQYFVGENTLTQLDLNGNKITGNLADKYVLKKVEANVSTTERFNESIETTLENTKWKLVRLMGKEVKSNGPNSKEPFVHFLSDGRFSAYAGCNSITGSYELKNGNRIIFSKVSYTMMACEDMNMEALLAKILGKADNYTTNGNTLNLNKSRMAPLASFVAIK